MNGEQRAKRSSWLKLTSPFASGLLACVLLAALVAGVGGENGVPQSEIHRASARELGRWWLLATRSVVSVVLSASVLSLLFGTLLGASAVYGGARAGAPPRWIELLGSTPALILVGILRLTDPSGGVIALIGALALLRTLEVAELVRARIVSLLASDFLEASRALGASRGWQLRVHILPRLVRPLLGNALSGASALVGLEAALSLVGLGLPADVPSWGGGLAAAWRSGGGPALMWIGAGIGLTSGAAYALGLALSGPSPRVLRPVASGQLARESEPR